MIPAGTLFRVSNVGINDGTADPESGIVSNRLNVTFKEIDPATGRFAQNGMQMSAQYEAEIAASSVDVNAVYDSSFEVTTFPLA
jgi:hypothetical protein